MIICVSTGKTKAISEMIPNLLRGNVNVPNASFTCLKPHKAKLLYLTRRKPSLKTYLIILNL